MQIPSFLLLGTVAGDNGGENTDLRRPKRRKVVIQVVSQGLDKRTGGSPLHPHFFDTLRQLENYADADIKLTLRDIRICFEAITLNCEIMVAIKSAIAACSKFLVILFSPGTLPDVAAPSPMDTADHLHHEGTITITVKTIFFFFITIELYGLELYTNIMGMLILNSLFTYTFNCFVF